MLGDEFALSPRGLDERAVALSPRFALPSFERGGVSCDVSVSALVCGPWDEGRAQRTRELVTSAGIWVPTGRRFGMREGSREPAEVKRSRPAAHDASGEGGWRSAMYESGIISGDGS